LLFAIDAFDRGLPTIERGASGVAVLVAIAELASFFVGYDFHPALDGIRTRAPLGTDLAFAAHIVAGRFGTGVLLLAAGFGAGGRALYRLVRHRASKIDRAVFILLSYSLLFVTYATLGRASLGPSAAEAPRYVTHLLGLYLGCYLLCSAAPIRVRAFLLVAFVFAAGAHELHQQGAYGNARVIATRKATWKRCVLDGNPTAACDARTWPVHPRPLATGMETKLRYLRAHRLNLFDGRFGGRFDRPPVVAIPFPR
jgi:hypothetical protein